MLWGPFFARVKVKHRRLYFRILAKMCAVAMATGWLKTRFKKKMVFVYLKKIQSLVFFHHLPTTN